MSAGDRLVRWSPAAAAAFFTKLADEFVDQPGSLEVAGRPAVSVLNLPDFVAVYGVDGVTFLIRLLRNRVAERMGTDPFVIGLLPDGGGRSIETCRAIPCDGVTGYGLLPDWKGPPVQSYAELIDQRVAEWYRIQRSLDVPFFPVACAGWDASRRGVPVARIQQAPGFPWRPVVTGSTPALFGQFLDHAIAFNNATKLDAGHHVVFVHAWNEWTEGAAVEPGRRSGRGYLTEIARRFAQSDRPHVGVEDK